MNEEPSDDVLAEVGGRAHKFLSAIASNFDIAQALEDVGFDADELNHGWALSDEASGRAKIVRSSPENKAAQQAKVELDLWDEPHFEIIRASLEHEFPEQTEFLFENLAPGSGWEAVKSVKTLLDRLDALENSPDRQATREQDLKAIAKLVKRKYTPLERQRLADLVQVARSGGQTRPGPTADEIERSQSELRQAKVQLWRWYNEWSRIARKRITRRDYLIRLGLAERKRVEKSPE